MYLSISQQKESCNLDTALLQHLDGSPVTLEEYDRIHRFIRLWRKLGWTIDETDRAIAGLGNLLKEESTLPESICISCVEDDCDSADCDDCDGENCTTKALDINPNLIHQLAAVKELLDKTGLELIKLLSFWNNISTFGEKSLYHTLFLTHNVLKMDKIFRPDDKGNVLTTDTKLLEHVTAVMAALNLTSDDIQSIMNTAGLEDKLTLSNLSMLYRYRLLSKVLGIRVSDFAIILPLFGNIFQNAHVTLEFMSRWDKMEEAGFTHQQLNYIIRDVDDEKRPFSPTKKDILKLSKTLYDGLNAIDDEHKDLKADITITDPALQKINIQHKATGELVRTKASLLYETGTVEKIIGILEGTNVFTTNGPQNLDFTLPDTSTLKNKLKYDKAQGIVQITGILTESESIQYKAINSSTDWLKSLTRIEKQQDKLFKELLSGVFENEKTKTEVEKTQLEEILKLGDIIITLDKIPEGEEDINTAPKKRAAFLEIFLPYLRKELSYRFVIDNLSNYVGLDAKTIDVLVSEVLKLGSPAAPIYNIFESIKESTKPVENNWSGYLIPSADTIYTFVVKKSDTKPSVSVDGETIDFTAQDDPTNEWWSISIPLLGGKLYKLTTTDVEFKNIFWKTPASLISPIPSSALIPDFASTLCEPALISLKKAAMLVSTFDLSADEVKFLVLHKTEFDNLDFNALTPMQLLRLGAYVTLRNSLPQGKINILDFLNWVYKASDETMLIQKITDLTTWKIEHIEKLIAPNHYNITKLEDYHNEKKLLKLQEALSVADKIGIDIDLLFDWAVPGSKFSTCRKIADSIKNAIRAKYNQTDWEQVIKPLHDQLRNNQKNALIDYLLQQKELIDWNVTDSNGLFEYFLIDVEMDACMETSRIKQAISSVQLFIQRCFLGLEEEPSGIKPDILDRLRWDWMQRYRVWEANRKVFLYPENWIESNLRDDKSPFFKELESELLQKDINKQNVTDALKSYLYKVDEVANMEVVGLYIHGTKGESGWSKDSKLHVFSRTRNAPYVFYYRYLALDEMNWYPWEKMQVDIPGYDVEDAGTHEVKDNGCYLTPVVWNERLLVFFPQIMKKTKPNPASSTGSFNSLGNDSTGISKSKPIDYYEIKMAWSEHRNGKWTQKQLSKSAVFSYSANLQYFKFVPIVYENKVLIDFDDNLDSDGRFKEAFEFNGTALNVVGAVHLNSIPIDYFSEDNGNLYSWQIDSSSLERENTDIYFYEYNKREQIKGIDTVQTEFNHPDTGNLLGKINLGQLELFFKENLSMPKTISVHSIMMTIPLPL
ncbi:neuraminidase-like domain-containing protein [Pseudobacteroides cellulosolvens]|uniref:neuraminidase-like domain-containing protein n=1 Tax=Pseudobacteroides cellulosolvens TaxID=35825 RepID=UPI00128F242E|nr:neuraminidase-like domain-containing protein [Pseudobacteroides cellulosolvens]